MAMTLPNLDDRTYADLVEEARALIPNYAPEWTNHNPSDPGITLVELFAYLTEMLIYRLNRVTDANVCAFLQLIDSPKTREPTDRAGVINETWEVDGKPMTREVRLTEAVRDVVLQLRTRHRAVTSEDYEDLVLAEFGEHTNHEERVARARCVPRRNLADQRNQDTNAPGHMSVIIVPVPTSQDAKPVPGAKLIKAITDYLEPRRLLTTRLHIVEPQYVGVGVRLTLHLESDAPDTVKDDALASLADFFDPVHPTRGWPFGRNVYVSEVYELLDKLEGVDFVTKPDDAAEELVLSFDPKDHGDKQQAGDSKRLQRLAGKLIGLELFPDELVSFADTVAFPKSRTELLLVSQAELKKLSGK